jgi:hypothetical protein
MVVDLARFDDSHVLFYDERAKRFHDVRIWSSQISPFQIQPRKFLISGMPLVILTKRNMKRKKES